MLLTFSGHNGLESCREESVKLEVVNLRCEIPHPDRVVLLSWQEAIGVVIQFIPKYHSQSNQIQVRPFSKAEIIT